MNKKLNYKLKFCRQPDKWELSNPVVNRFMEGYSLELLTILIISTLTVLYSVLVPCS